MIERRRLPSASYYSHEESWSRDFYADQTISVHPKQHEPAHVARKVALQQVTGAPFFVMDVPTVLRSVDDWNASLPRFQPHYAIRCNGDPVLARILADTPNMGFEVANNYELELALELVDPSRIIYSNPLWTRKAMRIAGQSSVGVIVVSSEKELLDAVAYAPESRLMIAVSVDCLPRDEDMGVNCGCSSEEAELLLGTAVDMRANFVGFSFNIDNSDLSVYYKALREVRNLFEYALAIGLSPNVISVGDGFRCAQNDKTRFHEVCDSLNGAVEMFFPSLRFPRLQLQASPGRFFASAAFSLCTNVIGKRPIDVSMVESADLGGKTVNPVGFVYQTNDGIYGSFGCRLADCNPQCKPLHDSEDNGSDHLGTVLGPTLDGVDVAQRVVSCRQLSVGEWLFWENMGAYSIPLNPEYAAPPVYYYTGKDHWDAIINKQRCSRNQYDNDASSDFASDMESVSSDDDVDLINRFDNFFD